MRDTVVYLGPTLGRADAERVLDAEYLPPICRGDLARLPNEVRFVGIIDGEFYQSLAVSPKEVLTLIRRGVTVAGASSMGALRAAETYKLGTLGVGRIFEMFRDGILDADDEVAVVYDPETYRPLCDPLVNLRAALHMAEADGVIDELEEAELITGLRALYFPERSYRSLEALCPRLSGYFRSITLPDVKRSDALELLLQLKSLRESQHRSGVIAEFTATH